MKNSTLAKDYITRAKKRLKAVEALYKEESWADVVRESQEVVELALKSLLRHYRIEVPRIHDVSDILLAQKKLYSVKVEHNLKKLADISHQLRRDRELAFYGSEDLTPSEFYKQRDAKKAKEMAEWVVELLYSELH
jgi:HEPN domain-containing protein